VKNRMREICTSGSVRGEGGNILTYSAFERVLCVGHDEATLVVVEIIQVTLEAEPGVLKRLVQVPFMENGS